MRARRTKLWRGVLLLHITTARPHADGRGSVQSSRIPHAADVSCMQHPLGMDSRLMLSSLSSFSKVPFLTRCSFCFGSVQSVRWKA